MHASGTSRSPGKASSPATDETGAGASLTSHPSIVALVMLPETTGGAVSSIKIVWTISTLVLLQASVTEYVRVIVIGQVPLLV